MWFTSQVFSSADESFRDKMRLLLLEMVSSDTAQFCVYP